MAIAALSSFQGNVVGISLGLIVGLVLILWLLALFTPAFKGNGMPAVGRVSSNLVGMLVTAAGSKWASQALLSDVDYSQILAPYILTVAILFFGGGSVMVGFLVTTLAKPAVATLAEPTGPNP